MLLNLNVTNFAIIDNIHVDFRDKMTVLTGETGAGKSLIIDAIGLLFGDRASSEMVRHGQTKSIIEGIFDSNDTINSYLETLGIDFSEELIISREIYANGKSICRVNGRSLTLAQLSDMSKYLGDIHTQLDTHRLINPKNYISFIDNNEVSELLISYKEELKLYRRALKSYNDLIKKHDEDTQKLEFLKFQLSELTKANLNLEEEVNLKKDLEVLNNQETILGLIEQAQNSLCSIDVIYDCNDSLEKLSKFDEKYAKLASVVIDCYYQLEDVRSSIGKNNYESLDSSQIDYINERLMTYSDLKRKYKLDTAGLIELSDNIKKEIYTFENYEDSLNELKAECDKHYSKVKGIALEIRAIRQEVSKALEEDIISNLEDLELKNTRFEIVFNEIDQDNIKFFENGIDEVNFMVSFNKGEAINPLNKVASGGELSRFMLALKCKLSKSLVNQTIIFDEIDSGVSGHVAYSIAQKISSISEFAQVLCITHLPQVAAIADNHLRLSKNIINERTVTEVTELDYDNRVIEIAHMISNDTVNDASINLAKELLKK